MARPAPLENERAIVERAMKGDKRAFEQIYRHYAPILYSYILVPMLGDKDDAHDCVHKTFISANKALPRYEWRGTSIYPWLKTLAKNKARDLLPRASGRRQRSAWGFLHNTSVCSATASRPRPMEERVQQPGVAQADRRRARHPQPSLRPGPAPAPCSKIAAAKTAPSCIEVKIGTLDVLLFRAVRAFRKACDKQGVEFDPAEARL